MDVSNMQSFIGSYGFPIVACCALFWQMVKSDERHKEEIEKLSGVVEQNNLVIQKLCERIDREDIEDV